MKHGQKKMLSLLLRRGGRSRL